LFLGITVTFTKDRAFGDLFKEDWLWQKIYSQLREIDIT
jgi:hypothetical protein